MSKFNEAKEFDGRFSVTGGTPSRVKKMTGTRFSKIIGCNPWGTPYQAWCEIMKVAEPPFEGNRYTKAGQVIEPKLLDYCKDAVSPYIVPPTEYFTDGRMRYDFFPENELLGGMWDALAFARAGVTMEDEDKPMAVIEAKTSSRPQDWENGVPAHYAVQGLLYAYLLDVEDVYFPVAFLEPSDYDCPEDFACTDETTRIYHLKTSEPFGTIGTIAECIDRAIDWWRTHVDGNISPRYDEKRDGEYLAIIRQCSLADLKIDTDDLDGLCEALYEADSMIEALKAQHGISEWEEKRKEINKAIQAIIKPALIDLADKDSVNTEHYLFTVSETRKTDYDKLEEDGLLDRYVTVGRTIRTKRK